MTGGGGVWVGMGGAVVIISPWFNYPSLKTAPLFLSRC